MRWLAAALLCQITSATALAQTPAHTTLRSSQLEVLFDRNTGLPFEYRLLSNQAVIHGATRDQQVTAMVFRAQAHAFEKVSLTPNKAHASITRCDFQFTAQQDGQPAASFTLRYELQGAAVFVSLEDIDGKARLPIDRRGNARISPPCAKRTAADGWRTARRAEI